MKDYCRNCKHHNHLKIFERKDKITVECPKCERTYRARDFSWKDCDVSYMQECDYFEGAIR